MRAARPFIGTMVKVYHLAVERTENYTYDAVGNRLSSTYIYEGSDTEEKQTYQYYTNSDRLKTDGKYAFTYDANGNLIEKGTAFTIAGDVVSFTPIYGEGVEYWQYDYDALNRLVKVTKSGLTADDKTIVEYVYDPTGLRLMKTKGTSTTQYAFDLAGNQIYDTAGGQEHCYIWAFGKTLARVDGDKDSAVKYFFHTDMLGSTVLVTGDEGVIAWTGDVTPFGEKVSGEGSFEGAVRFTGKEYDEDTGLYYFNARWYDPELGRFVEEDSYLGDPNDPATLNLYTYSANNPLLNVDPSGHTYASFLDSLLRRMGHLIFEPLAKKKADYNIARRDRLAAGNSGVWYYQACLVVLGYDLGSYGPSQTGVDGVLGSETTHAIKNFQKAAGLEPTGELDPETKLALDLAVESGVSVKDINIMGQAMGHFGVQTAPGGQDSPSTKSGSAVVGAGGSSGQLGDRNPMVGDYRVSGRWHSLRSYGPHQGVDYAAPGGTQIRSVATEGTVVFAGPSGGFGNTVVVDYGLDANGNRIVAQWAHLSSIDSSVTAGATVNSGDILGQTGNTGFCIPGGAYHLHYTLMIVPNGGVPYSVNNGKLSLNRSYSADPSTYFWPGL